MNNVPILVISCDRYSDVWEPFFKIFWKQWPNCPFPVYLGTNYKTYSDPRVKTLGVGEDKSWSENVKKMLDLIQSDYLILFLEDFFLKERVDTNEVIKLINIIKSNNNVGCLRLVGHIPLAYTPTSPVTEYPGLGIIAPGEPYRVSAQATIWKTGTLRKLLIPGFTAWDFEEKGTSLSETLSDGFWGVYETVMVYDQVIEKGKWKPEGLRICKEISIKVDLDKRRFFSDEDLKKYYLENERKVLREKYKHLAVISFKQGKWAQGLVNSFKNIINKPFSIKSWILLFSGFLGPPTVKFIEKLYLKYKLFSLQKVQVNKNMNK